MGILLEFRPDGFCSENDCLGLFNELAQASKTRERARKMTSRRGLYRAFPRAEEGRGVADAAALAPIAAEREVERATFFSG